MVNSENSETNNLHSDLAGTLANVTVPFPQEIHTMHTIVLNVGGEKHEVSLKVLSKFANSRLGKLSTFSAEVCLQQGICDDYSVKKNEYFFSRHPKTFNTILSFYYTGKLHMPDGICVIAFAEDMQYWEIEELHLDACCKFRYYELIEQVDDELREIEDINFMEEESFGNGVGANCKKYIWELFERPNNSLFGRILAFTSIVLIIVSTIILPLNTMPEFYIFECIHANATICSMNEETGELGENWVAVENYHFAFAEYICMLWFTFEYLARLIVAPEKCNFFKDLFNIFDLLAILPFYITLFIYVGPNIGEPTTLRSFTQVFRLMITLRVFKLARHNTGLQSFLFTLGNSYKELGILFLMLIMGVLTFSSFAYYAEKDDNQAFDTIPTAFWWAAVTMNAIGVGDMKTITGSGKLISFVSGVSGILFIGLPIPIVVESFTTYYNGQQRRLKVVKRCKSLKKQDEQEGCSRSILNKVFKDHSDYVGSVSKSLCQPDPDFSRKWELAKLSNRPLLNVGGFNFEVTWNMLKFVPNARLSQLSSVTNLASLSKLCDEHSLEDNSKLYFHRDHQPFSSIISLYLTGKFHLLEDTCPVAFETEMEYWMINETNLENCCLNRYRKRKEKVCKETKEIECLLHQVVHEENFGNGAIDKFRKYAWSVLEKPSRTLVGKFYGLISVTITMLSAFILTLKTMPHLKIVGEYGVLKDNPTLDDIEAFCIVWFGCEYTLRFLISPNKCSFLTDKVNCFDPFIVIFYSFSVYLLHGEVDADSALVLRHFSDILRILRLLRIFKLGKHSTALEALAFTLKSSIEQLGVLLLFLAIGVLIFSSLAYVAEREDNPQFESIPATFWWALTTMRTVAVGDMHTTTMKGKMISFVCGLFGLLFLLLPIPIIARNFSEFYKKKMRRDRSQRRGRRNSLKYQSVLVN